MTRYDCSQPIESGMPVYPGSDPVTVTAASTVADDGARVTALSLESHVGTHVDAPSHMLPDGRHLDDFSLDAFVFDARVVDCTGKAAREEITLDDVPAAVRAGLDEDAMLIFHTGWARHWGTDRYRDHPFLDPDLAAWCGERGTSVGLDAFSPDPTPSADPACERAPEPDAYPAHDALLEHGCRIVENLRGLDRLPDRCTLTTTPLPIVDADGSPVRAVAEA
jgi:kynurenine formamidase